MSTSSYLQIVLVFTHIISLFCVPFTERRKMKAMSGIIPIFSIISQDAAHCDSLTCDDVCDAWLRVVTTGTRDAEHPHLYTYRGTLDRGGGTYYTNDSLDNNQYWLKPSRYSKVIIEAIEALLQGFFSVTTFLLQFPTTFHFERY